MNNDRCKIEEPKIPKNYQIPKIPGYGRWSPIPPVSLSHTPKGYEYPRLAAPDLYDNRPASITLFLAKTNSLPLKYRVQFLRVDAECSVCDDEKEDLEHFILHCARYLEKCQNFLKLQQPYQENKGEHIRNILFNFESREEIEETKVTKQNF